MRIIASFHNAKSTHHLNPRVSILISAYNEEKVIRHRVENIAAQDYDLTKVEVIIGSDNSSDATNDILSKLAKEYSWLKVSLFDRRRGKASILNDLAKSAANEILVFTDANTRFERSALRTLLQGFGDEDIGGICGRLILQETDENRFESIEERKYWEYETFIKKSEGICGILIGANGGIFAVRKSLFEELPPDAITDDLYTTLSVLMKGYKFTYENGALAFEDITSDITTEFRRKVRFAATNFQTLFYFWRLLLNRNLLLSFAFWSHKILRWFYPFILMSILIVNILLRDTSELFLLSLYMQCAFYAVGLLGYFFSLFKVRITVFSVIYFFMVSNLALVVGFIKFVQGKQSTIWQSTPR
jgi:cellulose synthase/poly-beta-1,6-N-acetylglucosamine synthase-like glycosyltransferase